MKLDKNVTHHGVKKAFKGLEKKYKQIHNNKYTYKKAVYKGQAHKITITCPIHGEFQQSPAAHLTGQGCPECSTRKRRLTPETFIEKANLKHNNFYSYPEKYIDSNTKITITCPIHGEFQQSPGSHLHGAGCPECVGVKRMDTESFIKRASEIHNNKYDYSKVEYINNYTKVIIICPEHGEFEQVPQSHLRGTSCPACKKLKRWSKDEFIEKATKIHKGRFTYDKSIFHNSSIPIEILDTVTGIRFMQAPNLHLKFKVDAYTIRNILNRKRIKK